MATFPGDERLLDNSVWHALRGPLVHFVSRSSREDLLCFDPEVNVFSAVEHADEGVWRRIADRTPLEGFHTLFRDEVPPLASGWEEHFRGTGLQMVATDLAPATSVDPIRLGAADAPEMLALAELTEPGPFALRTHELGRYVGIRRGGRLLAMAGERLRVPGYVEVSAVCTHPDARGEGLAAALTLDVAHSIRSAGSEAFLHVLDSNENAIRLYERLGFVVRRKVEVVFAQWHGPGWQPTGAA